VHLVGQNIGKGLSLASGAPIQLFFDRLLLPISVTRQSVVLTDATGNGQSPVVTYDPVARAVQVIPMAPLDPCQTYKITLVQAEDASPLTTGIRAIDGATLDSSVPSSIAFQVAGTCATGPDAGATPPGTTAPQPTVDFCNQIMPIFSSKCAGPTCHGGPLPVAGLRLDSSQAIVDTMIGRVAQGSNQGPRSTAQAPSTDFGLDMPIVDPGSPGDSWVMYEMLMAVPPPCSSTANAAPCDASVSSVMRDYYSVKWTGMSDSERATLENYIPGRAMPFPNLPAQPPDQATEPLTLDELDTFSFWIAEGAPVPPCQ
jgi:hypothetical protein